MHNWVCTVVHVMELEDLVEAARMVKRYGIEGLRQFWAEDLGAAIAISCIALPFTAAVSGVAGVPIMAAVGCYLVCALVGVILGGARGPYLAVGGIAAGLAPLIHEGITTLGRGNDERGYGLMLVSGTICGLLMMAFALLKGARIVEKVSHAMIDGMLAVIGIGVMLKVSYWMMGVRPHGHTPAELFVGLFTQVHETDLRVLTVGVVTVFVSISYPRFFAKYRASFLSRVPEQAIAVTAGTLLALAFGLKGRFLLQMSGDIRSAFRFPSFGLVWADPTLWREVIMLGVSLAFVASAESLTTVKAVDRADKVKGDLNWALLISAVSNGLCALCGFSPSIFGGVKSTANFHAGARTAWSSLFSAIMVSGLCVFATSFVNLLPMAALGAVVWMTGVKLAHPKKAIEAYHDGWSSFLPYLVTLAVGLSEDLFWGIVAGGFTDLACKGAQKLLVARKIATQDEPISAATD